MFNTGAEDGLTSLRRKAAVNIEIQGVAPFQYKGNLFALGPCWMKWFQSFPYFSVVKGVVNNAQKKFLLLHTAGVEV